MAIKGIKISFRLENGRSEENEEEKNGLDYKRTGSN